MRPPHRVDALVHRQQLLHGGAGEDERHARSLDSRTMSELVERARVFVEQWAKVEAGERVLVLADDQTDPEVARAVLAAARATGADVTFVEMPRPDSAWAEPSEVVLGAMKQAQKCLSLALVYHDRRTTIARREHGMAMFFLLPPVPATLFGPASLLPDRALRRDRPPVRAAAAGGARDPDHVAARHRLPRAARPAQLHRRPGRLARGVGSGPRDRPDAGRGLEHLPARRRARLPRSGLGRGRRRVRAPRRRRARARATSPSATRTAAASPRRARARRRSPRSSTASTTPPTSPSSRGARTRTRA